jgi:aldose 1-epimerase
MYITTKVYGQDHLGHSITEYTLHNASGASVSVLDLGGIITRILVHDRDGKLGDVTLGYDDAISYIQKSGSLGALIGRVGNRIAGASFSLEGKAFTLTPNNGPNNLHGGPDGFNKRFFKATITDAGLKLSLVSPDGDQGFPGALSLDTLYTFDDDGALGIEYRATTDKTTIVNLTNHAYFNLDGHDAKDVKDQILQVFADRVTEVREGLIPTGKFLSAADVVYGFQTPTRIGDVLDHADAAMQAARGIDFNFCAGRDREYKLIAALYSPKTGREMQVFTDLPGVQVYSGQGLNQTGKSGAAYQMYGGLCLETQRYPDSIHQPHFPSVVLRPEEVYYTKTTYRFSIR